ncbi:hypothetical protein SAMN05421878_10124 [Actinobaculum suis]|uniref:Uncharacterized protein n=1 Tax=Actinobaculum suis TaxID=1657 RepID=A0A1G6Z8K9_9ACTO|nr:hypothetical protein SAMN05421878_10124 [Actinobaculum suis]VDG76711.1 Uncharacterised protein [Actinobaculum suis]
MPIPHRILGVQCDSLHSTGYVTRTTLADLLRDAS